MLYALLQAAVDTVRVSEDAGVSMWDVVQAVGAALVAVVAYFTGKKRAESKLGYTHK